MQKGFIVCIILGHGSLQPVFAEDDRLMFFKYKEHALAEIRSHIDDVKDAIKQGYIMKENREFLCDYTVLRATLEDDIIECEHDGVQYTMNREDDDWTIKQ